MYGIARREINLQIFQVLDERGHTAVTVRNEPKRNCAPDYPKYQNFMPDDNHRKDNQQQTPAHTRQRGSHAADE